MTVQTLWEHYRSVELPLQGPFHSGRVYPVRQRVDWRLILSDGGSGGAKRNYDLYQRTLPVGSDF